MRPEPEPDQLPARHHAMLPLRELGDQRVRVTSRTFAAYMAVNVRFVGMPPSVVQLGRRRCCAVKLGDFAPG